MSTQSTDDASYAFAYLMKLFRSGLSFDCSGGISFASRDAFNTNNNKSNMKQSTKKSVRADSDISDIIDLLINILGDTSDAIGLLETFIDSQTVLSEWEDGDYFEAGLYAGKGVTNAGYTIYGIANRWIKSNT